MIREPRPWTVAECAAFDRAYAEADESVDGVERFAEVLGNLSAMGAAYRTGSVLLITGKAQAIGLDPDRFVAIFDRVSVPYKPAEDPHDL